MQLQGFCIESHTFAWVWYSVLSQSISSLPSCTLQGCILCSHVRIEERVTLKDCFVGANFTVTKEGKLTWALAQCFKPHDVPSSRLLSFLCACKESLYYGLLLILDCMPGNSVMYKMNTSVISSCYFIFPLAPLYISHMCTLQLIFVERHW